MAHLVQSVRGSRLVTTLKHPRAAAVATLALPYLVLFAIYQPSVAQVVGTLDWSVFREIEIAPRTIARFTELVSGSFFLGIAEAFLRVAGVASVVVASIVLGRSVGPRLAAVGVSSAIVLALGVFLWNLSGSGQTGYIRLALAEVFAKAVQSDPTLDVSAATIDRTIALNLLALTAGYNSLLLAFAALAVRERLDESTPDRLRRRFDSLTLVTITGAVLLVCTTAVNKALALWPHGLVAESQQKALDAIGTAMGNFWGAFGTIALLCALVPPLLSLKADVALTASSVGDAKAQAAWRKENGFELDLKSGLGATLTTAAPILTGPGIDLLGKLFA